MADYQSLINTINGTITDNNHRDIDGPALNSVLQDMVADLGKGYQFMGVATPTGTPATTDAPIFYIAGSAGTYTNFGGIVVSDDEVAILKKDSGGWSKATTGAASAAEVSQLGQ